MSAIDESIRNNPEDWIAKEHTFVHKSGLKLWTSNGFFFLATRDKSTSLSFAYRLRIWKAYKWWCNNAPIDHLSKMKFQGDI